MANLALWQFYFNKPNRKTSGWQLLLLVLAYILLGFHRPLFFLLVLNPLAGLSKKPPCVGAEGSGDSLASDVGSNLASNNPELVEGISSSLDFIFPSLGVAIFSMSKNLG